jgi:hypothetical protein
MGYTEDQLREAWAQDEIARLGLKAQGGPMRPEYAGLSVPERGQPDELDDADLVAATMELAARTDGRASFGDVADAADELAMSRSGDEAGTTTARANALAELAGHLPDSGEALKLARSEVDGLTSPPATDGRVTDLAARYPDMLSDEPRGRQLPSHVTVVEDEDPTDRRVPRSGGAAYSAEADRLPGPGRHSGLRPGPGDQADNQAAVPGGVRRAEGHRGRFRARACSSRCPARRRPLPPSRRLCQPAS